MKLANRFGSLVALLALALAAAGGPSGCSSPASSGGDSRSASASAGLPPSGFVRLERNVHPFARPELDRGPVDPGQRLDNLAVVFKRSPRQQEDLDALVAAVTDPASPRFRQWLTPEQYAARFGASAADIARTRDWLSQQGFHLGETSRLGTRVPFGGTVAQLQAAFQTQLHHYEVGGALHYAMTSAPAIPAALAESVLGLKNTHDFYPRPVNRPSRSQPRYQGTHGDGLLPADWANVYDVAPLYTTGVRGAPIDGSGVTIAVVGVAQIAQSDIDAFRTLANLPASTVTMTLVPGTGAPAPGQQGSGSEAVLDVEWSGGIAPGATINYVFTGADDGNVDDASYYIIEQNLGSVLSESWGGCEQGLTPADADITQVYGSAANVLGITYVAAQGDTGADGCGGTGTGPEGGGLYVGIPAAYPGVTAVGGTEFPAGSLTYGSNNTATGYSEEEQVWNDGDNPSTNLAQGSGGISVVFSRPSYQSAIPTCSIVGSLPVSGVDAATMREVPDVAVAASGDNNPYFIECTRDSATHDCGGTGGSPHVSAIGGTSCGTPSFAGVVALLDQIAGGRLGNINPMLYTLNASTPAAFHDITAGNNEVMCTPGTDPGCPAGGTYGYAATKGYDCASGLGSLDVAQLAAVVATLAPTTTALAVSPTMTTEGTPVDLTATVAVPAPNTSVLGGLVTFAFQAYTASGAPDISWTLGTAPITGATVSGGTATLPSTAVPPGMVHAGAQYVDLVASYGGDGAHLPSTSAKQRLTFSSLAIAISPTAATVAPGTHIQFASTGGVAPVRFYVTYDLACATVVNGCSSLDETTGAFTAGPVASTVVVAAIDADGAEAIANVTVEPVASDAGVADASAGDAATPHDSGAPSDAATSDSSSPDDASGAEASHEAGTGTGAGTETAGCGCIEAGDHGTSGAGTLAGMGLAVIALSRRNRRAREPVSSRTPGNPPPGTGCPSSAPPPATPRRSLCRSSARRRSAKTASRGRSFASSRTAPSSPSS